MFLSGERHERQLQISELVEGYSEFCDFDPRQLRWIEALRTLRLTNSAAWLARRWDDPAFPRSFTWFNTERYWAEHILELREQMSALFRMGLLVENRQGVVEINRFLQHLVMADLARRGHLA